MQFAQALPVMLRKYIRSKMHLIRPLSCRRFWPRNATGHRGDHLVSLPGGLQHLLGCGSRYLQLVGRTTAPRSPSRSSSTTSIGCTAECSDSSGIISLRPLSSFHYASISFRIHPQYEVIWCSRARRSKLGSTLKALVAWSVN